MHTRTPPNHIYTHTRVPPPRTCEVFFEGRNASVQGNVMRTLPRSELMGKRDSTAARHL
jgi:hypothetical protein